MGDIPICKKMKQLNDELRANAAKIQSDLSEEKYGHLETVLTDMEYNLISHNIYGTTTSRGLTSK